MEPLTGSLSANIADLAGERLFFGEIAWRDGRIEAVTRLGPERPGAPVVLPGFIDAHVHIESSMLTPAEFGRIAVRHGTVAVVADPHEVANVLGVAGVRRMLEEARASPCRLFFGAPSCVPATPFESAGGRLGVAEIDALLAEPEVVCLAEMMNFPGVLAGDAQVGARIQAARARGRPVDGHAPGLTGPQAARYAAAGITTDHECTTLGEARDKIAAGMHILIREGSAARNFDALAPLIAESPARVMFCSDDNHPDDLVAGHIDRLAARAVAAGHPPWPVLRAACLNPIEHYELPVGRLRPGDPMDAIEVADLRSFRVLRTWVGGALVAEAGASRRDHQRIEPVNRFVARRVTEGDLRVPWSGGELRVIEAADGTLLTRERRVAPRVEGGCALADPARDLLLLAVLNRYAEAPPAVAFVSGFGIGRGALASSVAHDSHNVVAVGSDAALLVRAMNAVVEAKGGIAVAGGEGVELLPLPFAGLMSLESGDEVARRYQALDALAKQLGCRLRAPFMTLSFMALLVIPELKLSDRGLFDGRRFEFVPLWGEGG